MFGRFISSPPIRSTVITFLNDFWEGVILNVYSNSKGHASGILLDLSDVGNDWNFKQDPKNVSTFLTSRC